MEHTTPDTGKTPVNVSDTGRIVSALAGAWILARALNKRNLGIINGAAAAFLLYRGLSGHCPATAAIEKAKDQQLESNNFTGTVEDPEMVSRELTP
jgi:zinc transporter ZupT